MVSWSRDWVQWSRSRVYMVLKRWHISERIGEDIFWKGNFPEILGNEVLVPLNHR
jgi:hypothetical protein